MTRINSANKICWFPGQTVHNKDATSSTSFLSNREIRKLESVIDDTLDRMHDSFRTAPNSNSTQQNETCLFDLGVEDLFSSRPTLLSVQQRLHVLIYELALHNWRQLRMLQGRKIILQLRIQFYQCLMRENAFLDWTVMFNPPINLCNTQRAIESTVAFVQSKELILFK